MLFPDYKNTTSVTLTTNTNPSYTVTQDCMVYSRLRGNSESTFATAELHIDDVRIYEAALSYFNNNLTGNDRVTLFIKAGSTVSLKKVSGNNDPVSVTLKLIPLTNMGGGGCNDLFEVAA